MTARTQSAARLPLVVRALRKYLIFMKIFCLSAARQHIGCIFFRGSRKLGCMRSENKYLEAWGFARQK